MPPPRQKMILARIELGEWGRLNNSDETAVTRQGNIAAASVTKK